MDFGQWQKFVYNLCCRKKSDERMTDVILTLQFLYREKFLLNSQNEILQKFLVENSVEGDRLEYTNPVEIWQKYNLDRWYKSPSKINFQTNRYDRNINN